MRISLARRRSLTPMAGAFLVVILAACGGGAGGGSAAPTTADPSDTKALAAAAAKEGKLVYYTTFASDDVNPMIQAFNKVYPKVKVEALRLSADKIPQRVITEQRGGKFNADVISGESVYTSQLIHAGALQPYKPPDEAPLPSSLDLPAEYPGVIYANTTVIAYNPTALKAHHLAPPKTWQDLTKPEWKGHFSIDPGAVNFYQSLITWQGHDKALKLIQGLGANNPSLVESHTQAVTQVQSGEPLATATAYGYKAAKLAKKTPDQLTFVNNNPLPTSLTLLDIAKNSPHPNAARLFINWTESKEGQQAISDITNHVSLRNDVSNDKTVWDEGKWPPAWVGAATPDTYNKYVEEYKQALNAG